MVVYIAISLYLVWHKNNNTKVMAGFITLPGVLIANKRNQNIHYTWSTISVICRRCHTSTTEECRKQFEKDFLASHIETTGLQKLLLASGSAVMSLLDPMRADMIAVMGETGGDFAIKYMLQKMQTDEECMGTFKETHSYNSQLTDKTEVGSGKNCVDLLMPETEEKFQNSERNHEEQTSEILHKDSFNDKIFPEAKHINFDHGLCDINVTGSHYFQTENENKEGIFSSIEKSELRNNKDTVLQ